MHLLTGLVGLALAGSWSGARLYAYGFGLTYLVVTAIGFALGDGESILGLIPINTEDNILHLAIAMLGLLAAIVTPAAPRPTPSAAQELARARGRACPTKGSRALAAFETAAHLARDLAAAALERAQADAPRGACASAARARARARRRPRRRRHRPRRARPAPRAAHDHRVELGDLVERGVGQLR